MSVFTSSSYSFAFTLTSYLCLWHHGDQTIMEGCDLSQKKTLSTSHFVHLKDRTENVVEEKKCSIFQWNPVVFICIKVNKNTNNALIYSMSKQSIQDCWKQR